MYYDSYRGAGPNIVGRLAAATNGHVREVYGYTPAGELSSKAMSVNGVGGTSYTYNSQGQVASVTYPTTKGLDSHGFYVDVPGAVYEYSFDSMGRPAGLVRDDTSTTMVNNVQYGPAGEMTQMVDVPANLTHTFQYNNLLQLTRTTSKYSGAVRMDIQYSYSSTENNGKITQSQDYVTGEQVNYQYDCLQRLVSAATTGSQWGLSFTYDGFGNRLSEQATKGSAPTVYSSYDTATNRITGYTHDANGNITHQPNGTWLTYDVENRIVSANANGTIENYAYAPDGKRVYRQAPDGTQYIFFYGVQGERIGPYLIGPYNYLMTTSSNPIVYFAGRRLGVNEDRLGSQRNPLYPYGESENAPYSEDDVFFATYVRDGVTGLDYAVNRYYSSIIGRFMTPDPYKASSGGPGNVRNPGSWNRYAYVLNDPINFIDPQGLNAFVVWLWGRSCHGWPDDGGVVCDMWSTTYVFDSGMGGGSATGGGFDPGDSGGSFAGPAALAISRFVNYNFSGDCLNFIVNATGVEVFTLQRIAAEAKVVDASIVSAPAGVTAFPKDPSLAAAEQERDDTRTGITGTTIAQLFASQPTLYAEGQYRGDTIFYSAQAFSLSGLGEGYQLLTMFHETLHLAGFSDAQLKADFGITDAVWKTRGTTSITDTLLWKCGQ